MKTIVVIMSLCSVFLEAKNLGTFGQTFEILEEDLLDHIMNHLKLLSKTGRIAAIQQQTHERMKEMLQRPKAIAGISKTQRYREYTFDPSITVTRDLSDQNGRVFVKQGETVNPLEQIEMKPLLFIDGDDHDQVQWAISKIQNTNIPKHNLGKIVLIKGSPLQLKEYIGRDVYFDQQGVLTTKLGIAHVPAIVFQKQGDKVLTIVEEEI